MWIDKKNISHNFYFSFCEEKSRANPFELLEYANEKTVQTWCSNFIGIKITDFDSKSYSSSKDCC